MTIFINPDEPFEYRFEGHKDLGFVLLKPPTKTTYRRLGKVAKKIRENDPGEIPDAAVDGVKLVVAGWELEDEDGEHIPFETDDKGVPTDETVMRLPLPMMSELILYAYMRGTLSEDDLKNSP